MNDYFPAAFPAGCSAVCSALRCLPPRSPTPTPKPRPKPRPKLRAQTEAQTEAESETLASGDWTNKGYDIHGNWKIVAQNGKRYIVFDENFKTRRGPDLKVYLSSRPLASVTDRTVEPNSVEIAPLKSARGAQEYEIPPDLDLGDYRSLLIHCKAYSHLWGGAKIAP